MDENRLPTLCPCFLQIPRKTVAVFWRWKLWSTKEQFEFLFFICTCILPEIEFWTSRLMVFPLRIVFVFFWRLFSSQKLEKKHSRQNWFGASVPYGDQRKSAWLFSTFTHLMIAARRCCRIFTCGVVSSDTVPCGRFTCLFRSAGVWIWRALFTLASTCLPCWLRFGYLFACSPAHSCYRSLVRQIFFCLCALSLFSSDRSASSCFVSITALVQTWWFCCSRNYQ